MTSASPWLTGSGRALVPKLAQERLGYGRSVRHGSVLFCGRCAYRHSHMCRPCWPHSPDVHFFSFHGFNELLPRPLHIHHETVAFGRNEGISIRREPRKNVVSNVRVNLLSFENQALVLQATLSRYNGGHGHGVPAIGFELG